MTALPALDCFVVHYGFPVSLVDSDTVDFIALGHHDWRVIAAFNRLARPEGGLPDRTGIEHPPFRHSWAIETTGGSWDWRLEWDVPPGTPGAFPVTLWLG